MDVFIASLKFFQNRNKKICGKFELRLTIKKVETVIKIFQK